MIRTQTSLTEDEQRALRAEAMRTGRSVSALIRDAVESVYGDGRSAEDDLAAMRRGFGAWKDRELDGASSVERIRTGTRLQRSE